MRERGTFRAFPELGIGFVGVAPCFLLSVLTMAYVSGLFRMHLNPAVTVGLVVGKRFALRTVVPYVVGQLSGAVCAARGLVILLVKAPF